VVVTGEPDEDLVSYDAAATVSFDRGPGYARLCGGVSYAEVSFDRGPGYARLCGGVSYADVDAVDA